MEMDNFRYLWSSAWPLYGSSSLNETTVGCMGTNYLSQVDSCDDTLRSGNSLNSNRTCFYPNGSSVGSYSLNTAASVHAQYIEDLYSRTKSSKTKGIQKLMLIKYGYLNFSINPNFIL